MKDIVLPDNAFSHAKKHVVLGRQFVRGRLRVSDDDAIKMTSQFVNFYGCTIENVVEPKDENADGHPDADAALTVDTTKKSAA